MPLETDMLFANFGGDLVITAKEMSHSERIRQMNINVCCDCGRKLPQGLEANCCQSCLEAILTNDTEET